MFGLLNIDKPAGITSRDVVNQVQRLIRPIKVGHAGTLDPLATGVLMVVVGSATRLTEYAQQSSKTYVGDFRFGLISDTEDITGQVETLIDPPQPSLEQIEAVLPQFLGTILQRPPIFSALKVAGRRAYDLARQGEVPELAPRPIEIHALKILAYEYPDLKLEIVCGSGTYVRSLGRDIALALGTGALMTALVRTRIGPWHLENALTLPQLTSREIVQQNLLPPSQAVAHLAQRIVTSEEVIALSHGKLIPLFASDALSTNAHPIVVGQELAAIGTSGELISILQVYTLPDAPPVSDSTSAATRFLKVVRFFPDCLPAKSL